MLRALVIAGMTIGCLAGPAGAARAQADPGYNPHGELQTPDRSGTASLPNAASAPLHDLNILRQGIPTLLLDAIADPYAPPAPLTCAELGVDVAELDHALGADFDHPDTPQAPSLTRHNGHIALALVHAGASLLLPYSGIFRTVTGAQRHDQLIIEAITAGSVRRGYLKGLGEALRCPPPAIPIHRQTVRPRAPENGDAPNYPIR